VSKENMVYTQWSIIEPKEELTFVVSRKMGGTGDHHIQIKMNQAQKPNIAYFHS
jgi:hypothetical protein